MKRLLILASVFALIACSKKDDEQTDTSYVRAPDSTKAVCMVETTKVTGKNEKAHVDTTCP